MDPIVDTQREHLRDKFIKFGASPEGVAMKSEEKAKLRYDKMAALWAGHTGDGPIEVLDVGCGYGAFLAHCVDRGMDLRYTGIDTVGESIAWAQRNLPGGRFLQTDFLSPKFEETHDYIICCGVMTYKGTHSLLEMNRFQEGMVARLFERCRIGVAVNFLSNQVNFTHPELFYKSPVEIAAQALRLTRLFKIDHSYLYEHTLYLYRE